MSRFGSVTRRSMVGLLSGAMGLLLVSPAIAEVSFEGKTIEWIIPYSAGGGTDVVARFNAPYMAKYLPGNPNIAIVNQPGGGSTKGANLFASRAKPDGLTTLWTSGSTQIPYLLGDPRVRYEYRDWRLVLVTSIGEVLCIKPDLGVRAIEDIAKLKGQSLTEASQGPTSASIVNYLGYRLLGLDVRSVFGFRGGGEIRLAFERGETNIISETSPSYLKNMVPLVEAGEAVPLFAWGTVDADGNLVRDPSFPNLPSFGEVYEILHGEKPSGEEYETFLAFYIAAISAQKMMFLPRGTPDDIVAAYQDAVTKMKADPEYQAAKESLLGKYEQVTGEQAQVLFEKVTTIPDSSRQKVMDMLAADFGVKLGQ